MNNADLPASPVCESHAAGIVIESSLSLSAMGLTKREEFASRNMASLLATAPHWEKLGYSAETDSSIARRALDAADALLAELEKF